MSNSIVLKQFILSSLMALITSSIYLFISYKLDNVMDYNVSNIIGLSIDHIINFLLQQLVFVGNLRNYKKFIHKFTVGNIITLSYSQILFILIHKYIQQNYPDFYEKKWRSHISIIRYFIGFIVYPLSFLLRKYYVFT